MHRCVFYAAIVMLALAVSLQAVPGAVPGAVPDEATTQQARELVRDAFAARYAKRLPADRLALARLLLHEGRSAKAGSSSQYALWEEARELAIGVGDAALTMQTVEALTGTFQIDSLSLGITSIKELASAARSAQANAKVVIAVMELIENAIDQDRYLELAPILPVARTAASRCKDKLLAVNVRTLLSQLGHIHKEYDRLADARATLKADPDSARSSVKKSARAYLAVGRFYCLYKNQWALGLPMLAKGSDPAWQKPAKQELARPTDGPTRLALAHAWWELGLTEKSLARQYTQEHARQWYIRAWSRIDNDSRNKVHRRLVDGGSLVWGNLLFVPGLKTEIFADAKFEKSVRKRTDYRLNFDWKWKTPAHKVRPDYFSIRWTGMIQSPRTEHVIFTLIADDIAKLWINDKFVGSCSNGESTVAAGLNKGLNSIRIDYVELTREAKMKLLWSWKDNQQPQHISRDVLFHKPAEAD